MGRQTFYDEVEIEDFVWDPIAKVYHYPCPCGDRFEISKSQLRDGDEVAICPSCSLVIRVIYEWDDYEDYVTDDEDEAQGISGTATAPIPIPNGGGAEEQDEVLATPRTLPILPEPIVVNTENQDIIDELSAPAPAHAEKGREGEKRSRSPDDDSESERDVGPSRILLEEEAELAARLRGTNLDENDEEEEGRGKGKGKEKANDS